MVFIYICILSIIGEVLVVTASKGMKNILNITAYRGSTIKLKCDGLYNGAIWRGPGPNNGTIRYFLGLDKDLKLTMLNVNIDIGVGKEKYNLVIENVSEHNVGLYQCQMLNSMKTFTVTRFQVSLHERDVMETTNRFAALDLTTNAGSQQRTERKQYKSTYVIPFVAVGGFLIVISVGVVLLRKYSSNYVYTKWNSLVSFCSELTSRQTESLYHDSGEQEIEHSGAFQNSVYQSTQIIGDRPLQIMQPTLTQELNSPVQGEISLTQENQNINIVLVEPENMPQRIENGQSERNFQITTAGLNYSEILHEPVQPNNIREIRGLENRTVYTQIDHSLHVTALPRLEDSDNDSSSEDDFVQMNDIDLNVNKK